MILSVISPLSVDVRVLRGLLGPDIRLAPGRVVMARVADTGGQGRGKLSIAGGLVDAELPAQIKSGDELRLTVKSVSAERVVLTMSNPNAGAEAAQAPTQPVPLPGGAALSVQEDETGGGGGAGPGGQTLSLRYDAPALGPVDLHFALAPGGLSVGVTLRAGTPFALGRDGADELRDALSAALSRPVAVTVSPRREPLDVYA